MDESVRAALRQFVAMTDGRMGRILDRAEQGEWFRDWRLSPTVPQPGSTLDADDASGFPDVVHELVSGAPVCNHAVYPAMSAAENLLTVSSLVGKWTSSGQTRMASVISLCRSAFESSSRTVWILSPVDADERRRRTINVIRRESRYRCGYLEELLPNVPEGADKERREKFRADLQGMLDGGLENPGFTKRGTESDVRDAAGWCDENPLVTTNSPLTPLIGYLYSIESCLSHGYQWAMQELQGLSSLSLTADTLYASATITQTAVALYEASAAGPDGIADSCPIQVRQAAEQYHADRHENQDT